MRMNINEILEELYMLDPALRSEEAELKKIVDKLIEKKPDAEADAEFREKLKAELLTRFEQKKKRAGFFIVHRTAVVRAAGLAAALIIALTFALRPELLSGVMKGGKMTSSEQALESHAVQELSLLPGAGTADEAASKSNTGIVPAEPAVRAASRPESAAADETAKSDYEAASAEMEREAAAPETMSMALTDAAAPKMLKRSADSALSAPAAEQYSGINAAPAPASGILVLEPQEFGAGYDDNAGSGAADIIGGSAEEYNEIAENKFKKTVSEPLSTFSIDVDTASYSNVRRFITAGRLPDPDAVRIEELINYFTYDYPQPEPGQPFSFTAELSECPWNSSSRLLLVGLQGYEVEKEDLPPSNIVFLLDSSGSMQDQNKLPLLKESLSLLIDNLRQEDRISIVAYAGSAGLVLPPTPGSRKSRILGAIDKLEAGGSTAGGAGLDLAYKTAAENYIQGGNNRVILATDGDFNVGQSSEEQLKAMIEERRDQGIYLTVLGLGMGNYKDARMETLADNGNGNYAYIDTLNEAYKVLVTGLSSTLLTIAKDVKIQIDFNPEAVDSYRLVGYENRVMAAEDFDNDRKDAGEIGAGHSVTALYEIIPAAGAGNADRLAEIRFRYKKPDQDQSILIEKGIANRFVTLSAASDNFRFASAVAEWGLLLRESDYAAAADIQKVIEQAENSLGLDRYGYRKEFVGLARISAKLMNQ